MRRIAAYLLAGISACAILGLSPLAQAQSGPAQTKTVTFNFINGLKFDLPAGWRFSELAPGGVTLHYGRDDKAFAKENRNSFSLGRRLSRDEDVGKSYDRLDRQGKQTLANGTKVEWYAGPRFRGIHYGFTAQIENNYRYLTMVILDRPTPAFSPELVEQAILAIARSLRTGEHHRTFYHPVGVEAALPNDSWFSKSTEGSLRFGCFQSYCGKDSNTWLYAYPSAAVFKTDAEALKDITDYFEKQDKLKIGPTKRLGLEGGVFLWAEQPGTPRPLLGVLRRAGKFYFVSAFDLGTGRYGLDRLRPHYLQLAASLRPWNGK